MIELTDNRNDRKIYIKPEKIIIVLSGIQGTVIIWGEYEENFFLVEESVEEVLQLLHVPMI